ncbi:MAG: efflux RND transporter periplasmic adaptor subunit [Alphaproteobacteria bacterium]|nr:efflux RND transporter periplasmic adaptor subunit [Alphaproteobacteria bacterium]
MSETRRKKPSVFSRLLLAFISLAILGIGVSIAEWFTSHPAHTEKVTKHVKRQVYVTITPIAFGNFPVKIEVMGNIVPAHKMVLKAQVSGEIVAVSEQFIPGGFFKAGEEIMKIDPVNYNLAVKSKRAVLKQAKAALQLEEGRQQIAKNEIEILQRSTGQTLKNTDLALRKPQLEQAKADLDTAQSALDIALLDLKRTSLNTPFDAIVTERNTDLGNVIAAQSQLATLVSTNEYWIDLDISLRDLPWLSFPDNAIGSTGTKAIIKLGNKRGLREGEVFKQTGVVDKQSRLTGVIVRVNDPLLMEENNEHAAYPLILGDYVPVILIGKTLKGAARIAQQYVHQSDNGNFVWLEQGGKLVIQPVTVTYKDRKYAYITEGLDYATNLVTSNIITPVAGMNIIVRNNNIGN